MCGQPGGGASAATGLFAGAVGGRTTRRCRALDTSQGFDSSCLDNYATMPTNPLHALGFSDYEARAYLALLKRSPVNGYELAKLSGVPRPNIYSVLQKLEDRGAVLRVEAEAGVRYAPVRPLDLIGRLESRFGEVLRAARRATEDVGTPAEDAYVWSVRGASGALEHARGLIEQAEHELVVALGPQEARALAASMGDAEVRGVRVRTLCVAACPQECGACRGRIYRYRVVPDGATRWLVLVADGNEVLCAEMGPGEEGLGVRTRQSLLVDLATWFVDHTVALAALLEDLAGRLGSLLHPETRAILRSVAPADPRI